MSESRYGAVLDACVLVNLPVCDMLLRSAERGFYRPIFSETILEEVERALVHSINVPEEKAQTRVDVMRRAFPQAMIQNVPDIKVGLPDENDRHVLSAAVCTEAQAIVTFNLRHFPKEACSPFHVEPIHPDEFLVNQFDLNPYGMQLVLAEQIRTLGNPHTALRAC